MEEKTYTPILHLKILSIIAFQFINIIILIILITPKVGRYELTIYNAFPDCFWYLIIASIMIGIIILSHKIYKNIKSKLWSLGFFIIILSNIIFLLLPEFRGYAFYGRGDTPDHLGFIRDIIVTNHIGTNNFYPSEHIIGAELVKVTGINLIKIPQAYWQGYEQT